MHGSLLTSKTLHMVSGPDPAKLLQQISGKGLCHGRHRRQHQLHPIQQ